MSINLPPVKILLQCLHAVFQGFKPIAICRYFLELFHHNVLLKRIVGDLQYVRICFIFYVVDVLLNLILSNLFMPNI